MGLTPGSGFARAYVSALPGDVKFGADVQARVKKNLALYGDVSIDTKKNWAAQAGVRFDF